MTTNTADIKGTTTCGVKESEVCMKCDDRICSKVPIVVSIILSEDKKKIQNLVKVLTAFDLKLQSYDRLG